MARVKFLVDTVHPDHGYVSKGEVLIVDRAYVRDYEDAGIAEETDDDVSERTKAVEPPKGWGKYVLPPSDEGSEATDFLRGSLGA